MCWFQGEDDKKFMPELNRLCLRSEDVNLESRK